jgi:hypothetical protein
MAERIDRIAPKGKFRVLAVDTFDGTEWIHRDCDTKDEAIKEANQRGSTMIKAHVYDDEGNHLHDAGTF